MTREQAMGLPVGAEVRRPVIQFSATMMPRTLPGWQIGRVAVTWPHLSVVFEGETAMERLSDRAIETLDYAGTLGRAKGTPKGGKP